MSDSPMIEPLFPGPRELTERPARYSESTYGYLNRAAGTDYDKIRTLMQEWYSKYPVKHQAEWRSRLPGQTYPKFSAAFFELYMHELLRRSGYSVTVHPDLLPETTKRPEFLIKSGDGERCIVESITASNQSDAEQARQACVNALYDLIDGGLNSPNCFLSIQIVDSSEVSIPGRAIISFLEKNLISVDPEPLMTQFLTSGFNALPIWVYEGFGWKIRFSPIPKSSESRGRPGLRPLSIFPQEPKAVEPRESIADAVKKKASRYGQLDMPYIIAVNTLDIFVDHIAVMEALFGKEVIQFSTLNGDLASGPELRRRPDGRLFFKRSPINTRVSGVLLMQNVAPWNVASVRPILYLNPWAQYPYTGALRNLTRYEGDGQQMDLREGVHPRELFCLPAGWPGTAPNG